jgi:hypothetical protein
MEENSKRFKELKLDKKQLRKIFRISFTITFLIWPITVIEEIIKGIKRERIKK